jgi:cytochrome c oxidase subunit I+III
MSQEIEKLVEENKRLREGYSPTLAWLKKWLFTTDHKEVGLLYFFTSLWFLAIGGLLAMLMRAQLMFPSPWSFLTAPEFNQAVSVHGLIMVLFFLSPLGAAFANYFVPLQIGAKDVAYPRFNAFSYWMYLMGGIVLLTGFFVPGGAAAAGWTNYAPLNSTIYLPGAGETLAGLGLLLLWGSLTMGSVNLIITILTMRAPGVTWRKMPLFTWFVLFTQVQLLFSVPSIFVGTLALITDRALGTVFFTNPAGSSILWDHMWWFFGHPEVYIVLLPALGAVAEILQVFSGRPFYAKNAVLIAAGLILIPFSFSIYAHHMFLTGINTVEREFIDINTEINSIPSGLIVICMLLTVVGGAIKFKAPLLFAMASIAVFVIGGISGVFDSSVLLDQQLRGTYQVVAHFHYIMVGAAEFGLFAAIYYWLPKWTGRMYNGAVAKLHFVLSIVFFNMIFFPMLYLYDMPRRIYTYAASTGWGPLNFIETVGAIGFGVSQVLLLYVLVQAFRGRGPPAPPNPWNAATPEWTNDPVSYASNYPAVYAIGLPNGHSHPEHVKTPLNSRPFTISLGLGLAFIGMAVSLPLMILGIVVAAYGVYGWIKDDMHGVFRMPGEEKPGEMWPLKPDEDVPFGEWRIKAGVWLFIASDFVFFASLIGSYLFVRMNLPTWPSIGSVLDVPVATLNAIILLTSSLTMALAYTSLREGRTMSSIRMLLLTLILGGAFIEITGAEWYGLWSKGFTTSSGLPGSTFYLISGVSVAHIFAGLVILSYLLKKTIDGKFDKDNYSSVHYFGIFWGFIVLVWLFMFPLLYLT